MLITVHRYQEFAYRPGAAGSLVLREVRGVPRYAVGPAQITAFEQIPFARHEPNARRMARVPREATRVPAAARSPTAPARTLATAVSHGRFARGSKRVETMSSGSWWRLDEVGPMALTFP